MEGITRSPVFSHMSTSLHGLTTIRAFGVQSAFENKFDIVQDVHTSAWFLFLTANRWFGDLLDMLTFFFMAITTITPLFDIDNKTASEISLVITSAVLPQTSDKKNNFLK